MRDVIVVGDTSVLGSLLMSRVEEQVQVIAVANIGAEQGAIKMRDALVAVVASGIGIIEVEAHIDPLTGIHGKLRIDMVFTIRVVSAVVVEHIGVGRQRVHKKKLLRALIDKPVRLGKDKDVAFRTIDEYPTQTWGVVASCMAVLAIHRTIERRVHEEVGNRIGLHEDPVAEFPVECPGIETFGYLFVACRVVIVLVEVLVVATLRDIAHLVNLVKRILGTDVDQCQQSEKQQTQSFCHSAYLIIRKDDSAILKHMENKMMYVPTVLSLVR